MTPSFIERAIAELAQTVPNSIKRAESQKYSEMIPQAGMLAGGIYGGPPGAGLGASAGELLRQYVEDEPLDPKEAAIQGAIGVGSEVVPLAMTKGLGKLGESLSGLLPKPQMAGVPKSAADEALKNAVMMSREKPDWMNVIKGGGETSAPVQAEDIGVYPVRDPKAKVVETEFKSKDLSPNQDLIPKTPNEYVESLKRTLAEKKNKVVPIKEGIDIKAKTVDPMSWPNEVKQDLIKRFDDLTDPITGKRSAKTMEDLLSEAESSGKIYHYDGQSAPIAVPNFQTSGFKSVGENRIMNNPYEDPFQWSDSKFGAGKYWLEKKNAMNEPVTIHTSSDLIARDDYASVIPPGSKINLMAPTGDRVNRILFPGNASRARLEEAFEKLKSQGFDVKLVEPTKESIIASIKERLRLTGESQNVNAYIKKQTGSTLDELIKSGALRVRPSVVKGGKP